MTDFNPGPGWRKASYNEWVGAWRRLTEECGEYEDKQYWVHEAVADAALTAVSTVPGVGWREVDVSTNVFGSRHIYEFDGDGAAVRKWILDEPDAIENVLAPRGQIDRQTARGKIINWLIVFGVGGKNANDCADRIMTILDHVEE